MVNESAGLQRASLARFFDRGATARVVVLIGGPRRREAACGGHGRDSRVSGQVGDKKRREL